MAHIRYLVDLDLTKNQLLNAVVQNLAAAPTLPSDGQIYWSTVDNTLYVYKSVGATWIDLGASGVTNLGYTAAASQGTVTSNTGSDAVIPLAGVTNAGLFASTEKIKLSGIEALADVTDTANVTAAGALMDSEVDADIKTLVLPANTTISTFGASLVDDTTSAAARTTLNVDTAGTDNSDNNAVNTLYSGLVSNVSTNLSEGASTTTTVDVNSSDGTNATLASASTTRAGLMSKAKFDEVNVNNAKVSDINHNVSTNLSEGTTTTTTVNVNSSDGTNATLAQASGTRAGVLSSAKFNEIVANTLKVSDINHNVTTNLSTTTTSTTNTVVSSDGTNAVLPAATTTVAGVMTAADKLKLDGIEVSADVTDATTVNAAGAVMNSDTSTAAMSFVIDEDTMSSNSPTKVPTQQSVKSYVDGIVAANDAMVFKGTIGTGGTLTLAAFNALVVYNAGWAYKVITAGTYKGVVSEIGDLFIATVDRASAGVNADWTVVQTNIDGAVVGPASAVTNRVATFNGTSGKLIQDSGLLLSGSNTGDEPPASTTVKGIIEIATITETNAGTDATRAVSPDGLDGWTGSTQVTTVGTISTGTWNAGIIAEAKLQNQSGTNTGDNSTNTLYSSLVSDTGVPAILSTGGLPVLNTGILDSEVKTILNLQNVNNTSDTNKPISTLTGNALDLKAPLASPGLTGTPTAPTASTGTNTTQIATTAYVKNQGYSTTTGTVRKTQVDCAAALSTTVTHSSGQYASVSVYRKLTPFDKVMTQVTSTNATTVVVTFNAAPAAGEYVIVVQG